jgi:hypothetical protein
MSSEWLWFLIPAGYLAVAVLAFRSLIRMCVAWIRYLYGDPTRTGNLELGAVILSALSAVIWPVGYPIGWLSIRLPKPRERRLMSRIEKWATK